MTPVLLSITCSTRPTRVGPTVARWFEAIAAAHAGFEVRPVDLAAVNLPVFDEPEHPRLGRYAHEHTRRWSATVAAADAFVFVTPEYNYGPPPSLLNALTYLVKEWACKPCAFVSYGGVSGGTRAVHVTRLTATALKMMPLPEAVNIPFVGNLIKDGAFDGAAQVKAATALLDELHRWALALRPLRA